MASKKMYTGTVRMANGKRKYIRSVNKEAFNRKMQQARLEAGAGIDLMDNTTFGEFAQLWYDTYKRPYLRENSAEHTLYILNNHVMPVLAKRILRSITPLQIRKLMSDLNCYSRSLQSKTLQMLRSIFDAAVENHLIPVSPVPPRMRPGGVATEEKRPLSIEQSQRLLEATRGTRAHVAVALMLGAALRREEVCGLMWGDINFDSGFLHVQHAKAFHNGKGEVSAELKSRAAHRYIPLSPWLKDVLLAEKVKSNSEFVLSMPDGKSLTYSSWQKLWSLIETRTTDDPDMLGKPVSPRHPQVKYALDFKCHPHLLRHTCITRWVESGRFDLKEIQYMSGHATPMMTMGTYAHYDSESRLAETAKKMGSYAVYV